MVTTNISVPQHLSFILDGNRRWAKAHHKTVAQGHRKGYDNLKVVSRAAFDAGVSFVSAYVFSTENWQRDQREVKNIMRLLHWALKQEVKEIHKDNFRVRVIGRRNKFSASFNKAIVCAEELTRGNTGGTLILCIDYGGQQEIVDAVKSLIQEGISAEDLIEEDIRARLYAPDIPPPDLIIRTSGEQRLSNFLLWEGAYSELLFYKKNWPDYDENDLKESLKTYAGLKRRFGT